MPSVFAYWPSRGLVGQLRMIIRYVGEDCELKAYITADESKRKWVDDKYNLGLALPNLPYYIDGDIKITQSVAIERYLARKYKLEATTEPDRIRQDNVLYLAVDLQREIMSLCYNSDFENLKTEKFKIFKEWLKQLSNLLGESDYFVGSKINFVDFHLYEAISVTTTVFASCLEPFPNLQAFLGRIEDLPGVKEYLSSPEYIKEALTGPGAAFGHIPPKFPK